MAVAVGACRLGQRRLRCDRSALLEASGGSSCSSNDWRSSFFRRQRLYDACPITILIAFRIGPIAALCCALTANHVRSASPLKAQAQTHSILPCRSAQNRMRAFSRPIRALYAGSFDPPSNGHLDIIQRAVGSLCDTLTVAVAVNPAKKCIFTLDERVALLRKVSSCGAANASATVRLCVRWCQATQGLGNVSVDHFGGLVVDYAKRRDSWACAALRYIATPDAGGCSQPAGARVAGILRL